MILKHFSVGLIFRLIFIFITMSLMAYLLQAGQSYIALVVLGAITIIQFIELYHYANTINKKVIRFLDSVRYSDFSLGFTTDSKMGKTFKELNSSFHEVMEAFRKTRADKEQNLLIVSTVLQNIQTGIISFDTEGNIGIINSMTKKLLLTPQIKNMHDIERNQPAIYANLVALKPGSSDLISVSSDIKIALSCTILRIGNKDWKIVSIQNIYSELQQNELEAWQNLTKVLRHEIMNSITPIATLVSSMRDILIEDTTRHDGYYQIPDESQEDLTLGLQTIENRSKGLVNFVNAYRDYTNIPLPKPTSISAKELVTYVSKLLKDDLHRHGIALSVHLPENELQIWADEEQIQLVLINIIKNAKEALAQTDNARIQITLITTQNNYYINVEDNGPGIVPEAIERIFIPFYTTKKEGSGIGLALSRQIMQLHQGKLSVSSTQGKQTTFTLQFPRKLKA